MLSSLLVYIPFMNKHLESIIYLVRHSVRHAIYFMQENFVILLI